MSSYSDEFVPKSQKVTALLPLPLTTLYSQQNQELTYNELINCCEEVVISLSQEEIRKGNKRPKPL